MTSALFRPIHPEIVPDLLFHRKDIMYGAVGGGFSKPMPAPCLQHHRGGYESHGAEEHPGIC